MAENSVPDGLKQLTASALELAIAGSHAEAHQLMAQIGAGFKLTGIIYMLSEWADQLIRECYPRISAGQATPGPINAFSAEDGSLLDPAGMDPDTRWATEWITIRMNRDLEAVLALWKELPANPGPAFRRVLAIAAATIAAQRGLAASTRPAR